MSVVAGWGGKNIRHKSLLLCNRRVEMRLVRKPISALSKKEKLKRQNKQNSAIDTGKRMWKRR